MTKHKPKYKRIAQLKTAEMFRTYLREVGAAIAFDENLETPSAMAEPLTLPSGGKVGNRFCILPMEGWDGTTEGRPSEYTGRRWHHFAISGAKFLWGCEAVAVRHEGRANPNQLVMNETTYDDFCGLYKMMLEDHKKQFGTSDDLYVGLQLTHSGRFCKPNDPRRLEPKILYNHPFLNRRYGLEPDHAVITDDEIDGIVGDFVTAAVMAQKAGYQFVDIKHCHGYLGHEFLSAVHREGRYGGSFENRTRFLSAIVEGIRSEAPGLACAVRLSAFDIVPFKEGDEGTGVPEETNGNGYAYAFGGSRSGLEPDLTEPFRFLELLRTLGIHMVCVTGGSPYYNPHIQRPALFPPSDGYQPPEDPLVGVARHLKITADIKKAFPDMVIVGSGYSYLQEWLPHVAQHVLKNGGTDFIGLGRMVLAYPEMAEDILGGRALRRDRICRTFSDCTTAPRNAMISGCFPLDPFYKALPEAARLKEIKHE